MRLLKPPRKSLWLILQRAMEEEWERAKEEGLFNYVFSPYRTEKGEMEEMTTGKEKDGQMSKKLYNAAREGNIALLEELYKNNSDIVSQTTPYGNTALHIAAFYGRLSFVINFIQLFKADIESDQDESSRSRILNAANEEGNTALHEACSGGSDRVVRALLDEDEELARVKNRKDETPVFKAVENGHYQIVKRLLPLTAYEFLEREDKYTLEKVENAKTGKQEIVKDTALHVAVNNSKKGFLGDDVNNCLFHPRSSLKACSMKIPRDFLGCFLVPNG